MGTIGCRVIGGALALGAAAMLSMAVGPMTGSAQNQAGAPVVVGITPSTGPAGEAYPLEVRITGRGFSPRGNTVRFGPVQIADVPSSDGAVLIFGLPKVRPSRGEVPPMVLPPGEYEITVTNGSGTSRPIVFTLTEP